MDLIKAYLGYQKSDRRYQAVKPLSLDTNHFLNNGSTFAAFDRRLKERRVNRINSINPRLYNDIKQVKDVFEAFKPKKHEHEPVKQGMLLCAVSTVPFLRRFIGIKEAISNHEYIKGIGKALIQYLNVKEDWRDILKIFKPSAISHDYQIPFPSPEALPLIGILVYVIKLQVWT